MQTGIQRRRYRLALTTLEKALALRHELGDGLGEAITLGCMGRVYAAKGEHWCALSCYEAALDGYRQHQLDARAAAQREQDSTTTASAPFAMPIASTCSRKVA